MAEVESSSGPLAACLLYHPGVAAGDEVLVHMGFVVDVVDCQTAADAKALRSEIGSLLDG